RSTRPRAASSSSGSVTATPPAPASRPRWSWRAATSNAPSSRRGGDHATHRDVQPRDRGRWPRVIDERPTAPDPHAARRSPEMRAMGVMLNAAQKLVFSRTLKQASWTPARILPELDAQAIRSLKQERGKDLILFGSGSIVAQLTQHGLIDEYQL